MGKKKSRSKQREEALDPENDVETEPVSRRKSKKERLADPFFDEGIQNEDGEEDSPLELNKKPSKSKKAKNDFALLDAESEEEEDVDLDEDKDKDKDKDEDITPPPKKQSSNVFATFADVEDENAVSEEDEEMESEHTNVKNTFAALDAVESETQEEKTTSRKKTKKKKKSGFEMDNAFEELLGEDDSKQSTKAENQTLEVQEKNETAPKGKSKSKKKQDDFDAAFAMLEEEEESMTDLAQETVPDTKPKKGKKKKGKSNNFDALLLEMNAEDGEVDTVIHEDDVADKNQTVEQECFVEAEKEPAADVEQPLETSMQNDKEPSKQKGKKKKKKGGKNKEDDEDIDALLAEIEGAKESSATMQNKNTEEQEVPSSSNDVPVSSDKALEIPLDQNADATPVSKEAVANPVAVTEEESEKVENEDNKEVGEIKLTAAQKKKQRKKDKKAREKEQQKASTEEESKDKKIPAHVRKIQEQLEKKRLEEERIQKEQEAERLRLEEEERLRKEEEQRKEEEARRKAEEKERKEELKRQGKILTKKQKAEQARLAVMREQLLKSSGMDLSGNANSKPKVDPQEQRRIQREREEEKKKAEAERLKAEEEERLLKEEEEKKKQAELEAQRKLEEELQQKQAEEDEIADNWEEISEEEEEVAEKEEDDDNEEEEEEEEEDKKGEDEKVEGSESSSESESETETESEDSSSSEYTTDSEEVRERQIQAAKQKAEARIEEARAAASSENLRSPICCILGHVDTGKTKILDNIRRTNVQDNEAGGITQQIGATYIPSEALLTRTTELRKGRDYEIKVPGLLVIDTPGHESFTNLRTRGSSLCDIAILVVDLMHGLEAQTLESIELLRQKKTPFIIALNKVDRLNDWKVVTNAPIRETLNRQKKHTLLHYEDRLQACTTMLMERGLNVSLYWKNKEPRKIVNMVPTSAITGEGIADMLQLLIKLTTSLMAEKLMFLSEVQCSVLEVKAIEGLGTTIDVVLVNGQLNEGDKIIVCGMTGPIVTTIRSLLTPHPLKELRVKGSYVHHKSIQAAQGIKICAQNLEQSVAGTALRVVREGEEEECKLLAIEEMEEVLSRIDKTGEGVSVQASTLGSLEALLEFLKSPDVQIPISAIGIGPIHKKDVMRANVMNEKKIKKFAVILAFDVAVTREAREIAEELNVKIFTADIIYHLFDQFKAYVEEVRQSEKRAASADAVFPCILTIIPTCIFNKKDPIVLGCEVVDGQARIGTPLVVPAKGDRPEVSLGKIESMELNHKAVEKAERGDNIAIKIQSTTSEESARLYGRHFDHTDQLYSRITRESIDALKAFFRDEMTTPDWHLIMKLKKVYQIE